MTRLGTRGARLLGAAPLTVLLLVLLALVPFINNDTVLTNQLTIVALFVLALLGLNVAMGYTGMLSLATSAIFGLGAYASGYVDDRNLVIVRVAGRFSRVPAESWEHMLLSIAVGTLIGAVLGLLILLPALRLGRSATTMVSLYMAIGFPVLIGLERFASVTGGGRGLQDIRQLVLGADTNGDRIAQVQQIYLIVLGVTAVAALLVQRLLRSHWGRAFIAVRDDEVAAQGMGVDPVRTKTLALGVSALLAAFAGALFAHVRGGSVDSGPINGGDFDIALAIFFFSALVVGGSGSLLGPLLGALTVGLFQQFSGAHNLDPTVRDIVFGGLLLLGVVLAPAGIAGSLARLGGLGARGRPSTPALSHGATESERDGESPALPAVRQHQGLAVEGIDVRFGGNLALAGVSLIATPGRIHALVGANGSGKTTLLNVVSGLVGAAEGRVRIDAADAAGVRPAGRARSGLGRTFQTPRVAVQLSALENVLSGAFARYTTGWLGLFATPWRRRRQDRSLRAEASSLLTAVGLGRRADVRAQMLSHGERRLLEVARALIAEPTSLLLDEPAAGLAPKELSELAALIRAARDSGCTVVLVEHNLAFVRAVADDCTVLEGGRVIAQGPPDVVLAMSGVIESFVGIAV